MNGYVIGCTIKGVIGFVLHVSDVSLKTCCRNRRKKPRETTPDCWNRDVYRIIALNGNERCKVYERPNFKKLNLLTLMTIDIVLQNVSKSSANNNYVNNNNKCQYKNGRLNVNNNSLIYNRRSGKLPKQFNSFKH